MDGRSYRTFRSRSSFDPYDDANEDYDETGYDDETEDYDATDGYDCPPAETEDSDDESATENDDCLPAVTEDWKERQSTELSHSQAVGGSTTTALPVDTPLYATPYSPVMTPATPAAPAASEHSGIVPRLHNVVSSVDLGCKLDLKAIVLRARNAEYTPKRFAAVIMRIQEPRTTALIFGSGKMVCAGAKSEEQSRLAARKFARLVQKMGFPVKFIGFKIQNMVASCDVRFPIEIEGLFLGHQQFSSYEPEIFPGLIYRMVKPRVVLLIFVSGKLVLTGAKVRGDIYEAFENIYPILKNVRKTT